MTFLTTEGRACAWMLTQPEDGSSPLMLQRLLVHRWQLMWQHGAGTQSQVHCSGGCQPSSC